ncbi:hypothetical protein C479_14133 [Halovivax asiaticus JCM 14624]|uniref:Small CPxCG-related zinc finger protein n=1 Tax=Halovivax asiaticus JCM 14624 TaxID=1227490 RepID=M0BFR6_9EURY|nr:hypothetical protein C479_14133 [Halovivax asiaticus JCM 14624]
MIDLAAPADGSTCRNCGNDVTKQFARVFGDNDDVVHRCPECDNYRRMSRASGAGKSLEGHPDPETTAGHHGNDARADGGRRRDRGQTSVGWLVFTIVMLGLSVVPLLVVMTA